MLANHKHNLDVCQNLLKMGGQEAELARQAEVGTCTYRHHVDLGHLTMLSALTTTLICIGAMMEEQLEITKAIGLVVIHPKQKDETDGTNQSA